MTALIVAGVMFIAAVAGVCILWPNRLVRNVFRTARQNNAVRSMSDLAPGELRRRALSGSAAAQYCLGYLHATGDGVQKDYTKANYWLERAAQGGIIDAIYCLALHYDRGRGVSIDHDRAAQLYEQAARAGHADAQCNLGLLFLGPLGDVNTVRAVSWLVRAAAQRHDAADQRLSWILRNSEPLNDAEAATLEEIDKLAERGDCDALLISGWLHATGFGKPQDLEKARRFYRRAQQRGHIYAYRLAERIDA